VPPTGPTHRTVPCGPAAAVAAPGVRPGPATRGLTEVPARVVGGAVALT
jgi:hypothetical protein